MGLEDVIDWKSEAKALAKALAQATASALMRGGLLVAVSLVVNLALATVFFLFSGLAGRGHGILILYPLALVVFAPFVVLAFVIAQKNGVSRLVGAAVESQAPTLVKVGAHYLGSFLKERYGDLRDTRVGAGASMAWASYVSSRRDAPWAVRAVLSRIAQRLPLGELLDEQAKRETPAEDVPREVMSELLTSLGRERFEPSWVPVLVLFAANVAWLPIALYLAELWAKS